MIRDGKSQEKTGRAATKFVKETRMRQEEFKTASPTIVAKEPAPYIGRKLYPFCLSRPDENLYSPIRERALSYFSRKNIAWHDGGAGRPSNHMCSSQVCCVNFLFPLGLDPAASLQFVRFFEPDVAEVLEIDGEPGQYMAFEVGSRTGAVTTRRQSRFQPPPRRTRRAHFEHRALLVGSCQGL